VKAQKKAGLHNKARLFSAVQTTKRILFDLSVQDNMAEKTRDDRKYPNQQKRVTRFPYQSRHGQYHHSNEEYQYSQIFQCTHVIFYFND
jgi:hypothetical protein